MRKENPYLDKKRFPRDWATAEIVKQYLHNQRKVAKKARRNQRTSGGDDDDDDEVHNAQGENDSNRDENGNGAGNIDGNEEEDEEDDGEEMEGRRKKQRVGAS